MSGSRIRRCYITCRVGSIYTIRDLIACGEFISASGAHFPVHGMTAAYNSQTKEAMIYAEFTRVDEKVVEENMTRMGALSVVINSFSKENWEAETETAIRGVLECGRKAGFTLFRHGAEPRAVNRMGDPDEGGSASTGEGGMGGGSANDDDNEEPLPRASANEGDRSKRHRTSFGDQTSGMDWASVISSAIASTGSAVSSAVRSEREDSLASIQQERLRREKAEYEVRELRGGIEVKLAEERLRIEKEMDKKYEERLQAKVSWVLFCVLCPVC
jgi:hypothetical protein